MKEGTNDTRRRLQIRRHEGTRRIEIEESHSNQVLGLWIIYTSAMIAAAQPSQSHPSTLHWSSLDRRLPLRVYYVPFPLCLHYY